MTTTPHTVPTTEVKVASGILLNRKSLSFFNTHNTAICYIKDGKGVSTTNGIPVYPKGNVSLNFIEDGDTVFEAWWAIGTASLTLVVFEGFAYP